MINVFCEDCNRLFHKTELHRIDLLTERVLPDQLMPYGQCPLCGGLCRKLRAYSDSELLGVEMYVKGFLEGSLCADNTWEFPEDYWLTYSDGIDIQLCIIEDEGSTDLPEEQRPRHTRVWLYRRNDAGDCSDGIRLRQFEQEI